MRRFPPSLIREGLLQALLKEESDELIAFDKDVIMKWEELICEQRREMEAFGIPYFNVDDHQDPARAKHQRKILDILEDLIPGAGKE